MISEKTQSFIAEHGPWTAMAIKLADQSYTREPAVDYRLKRLLQAGADLVGKPLDQCRVVDLACLEGHYALEFASHGAQVLGVEGRQVSVDKCLYARDALGLQDRAQFVVDDVRNFNAEKYGTFDIVICSGIFYHLLAADCIAFARDMVRACSGVVLIDTFISLKGREQITIDGKTWRGHYFHEHDVGEGDGSVAAKLWASIDNTSSFWFTEPSLFNMLIEAGATTILDVVSPDMPGNLVDRKTYAALVGKPQVVLTSDATQEKGVPLVVEERSTAMDSSQEPRSWLFKTAKAGLPPSLKNLIKPPLRMLGVLPPDTTPEFMREKK